jgi:hypothetical protein
LPDLAILDDTQLLREGLHAIAAVCHTQALQAWQEQQLQQAKSSMIASGDPIEWQECRSLEVCCPYVVWSSS